MKSAKRSSNPIVLRTFRFSSSRIQGRGGFTLMEIMLVVALSVIIFYYALGVGRIFYSNYALISERDNVVNILRNARNLAMDNYDQSNHGLYVAGDQYILFEGDSYAARNVDYDESFPKSSFVSVSGPQEIVFKAPDGGSSVSGTIAFFSGNGGLNVYINSEGRIDW